METTTVYFERKLVRNDYLLPQKKIKIKRQEQEQKNERNETKRSEIKEKTINRNHFR